MAMEWMSVIEAGGLLFVLVNPFLLSIYLMELIRGLERRVFRAVLVRASLIATSVFVLFGGLGDRVFTDVLRIQFASFLIFGGLIFLLMAIRFVFQGQSGLVELRGSPSHIAGAVAMPFLIGPGTVSASVIIGAQLPLLQAAAAIVAAMVVGMVSLYVLKIVHDWVSSRRAELVERYVEIVGRLVSLLIGSIAVDMILRGVERWLVELSP